MISQSLIKDITPVDFCRHEIEIKFKEGLRSSPSKAMMLGLVFETKLLGAGRDGAYELPKLKNGNISKDESDLDKCVEYAKEVFKALKVEVLEVQPELKRDNAVGHLDFLGTIKGEKIIGDVKFTGYSKQQFERELKYGLLESYKIQVRHYQYLQPNQDFYFFIFGKGIWSKVLRFSYSDEAVLEYMEEYFYPAEAKFNSLDTFDYEFSYDKCLGCYMKDVCDKRVLIPEIEDYENYL